MRKIPATIATQHPDNSNAPSWLRSANGSAFISTHDEVEECYRVFSELSCDEYMWDWEGKFVDEAVIERLFNLYPDYFAKHQIGKDKLLTFRIPNISQESGFRLARSFMTLITAAHTAQEHKVHSPPIFEAILPMTSSASQLILVHKKYLKALQFEKAIFDKALMKPTDLEVIPLIEGTASLIHSRQILKDYIFSYEEIFGIRPRYLRPFIARSDPALDAGYLSAILSARGAISEYYLFQEESRIPVFPMIGVGSLAFRGGLSPFSLDRFFKNYAGIRTVTIQSAFRYDYPLDVVKKAICTLDKKLPSLKPCIFTRSEIEEISFLDRFFASHYRPIILELATSIKEFAPFIPSHRERIQHTGHFGYSRKMGNKTSLPRAITFSGIFYSLGIPPCLIGTGRALRDFRKKEKNRFEKKLNKYFPTLEEDLVKIGSYLNRENIKLLSQKNQAWKRIQEDVLAIEDLLGHRLEPSSSDEYIHRNMTSNVFHFWEKYRKKPDDAGKALVKSEVLRAAHVRRSIG